MGVLPILAHNTVAHYLQPLFQLTPLCWQYLDDLLIAHTDPHFLTYLVAYAAYLLTQGFILSLSKYILAPTQEITWLGRLLSSTLAQGLL